MVEGGRREGKRRKKKRGKGEKIRKSETEALPRPLAGKEGREGERERRERERAEGRRRREGGGEEERGNPAYHHPKPASAFLSSFPFPTQPGAPRERERERGRERESERDRHRERRSGGRADAQTDGRTDGQGAQEGGAGAWSRSRSRRRTPRGAFPLCQPPGARVAAAAAAAPAAAAGRPTPPEALRLARTRGARQAARHSDGSLPACLPISLDPRAHPAEHVQRASGVGQLSGHQGDHPGITGEDTVFLLSQTGPQSLCRRRPHPDTWAPAEVGPHHCQLTASDWQSPRNRGPLSQVLVPASRTLMSAPAQPGGPRRTRSGCV